MGTITIRDIQTKQKVGCQYCGRNTYGNPPKHEAVEEDGTTYYLCDNHVGFHIVRTRGTRFHPTIEEIEAEDDYRTRYDGRRQDMMEHRDEG